MDINFLIIFVQLPQRERAIIFQNNLIENYEKSVDCFQTNYYGVKNMMKVFLPLVQLSNFGRIVNVSSSLGKLQVIFFFKLFKITC